MEAAKRLNDDGKHEEDLRFFNMLFSESACSFSAHPYHNAHLNFYHHKQDDLRENKERYNRSPHSQQTVRVLFHIREELVCNTEQNGEGK